MPLPTLNHIHFDTIESTNTYARNIEDVPVGSIVLITASRQSAGRGQKGNSFFSDMDGGIWASLVIRIPDIADHFIYNRACALAICKVASKYTSVNSARIKWPNDIYINDRKVCGILIETHARIAHTLIIGFGLNVNIAQDAFPSELRDRATSLGAVSGLAISIDELRQCIIEKFAWYAIHADQAWVHEQYRDALYRRGARVLVNGCAGIFRDVAFDGHLLLDVDGSSLALSSGPMIFDNS